MPRNEWWNRPIAVLDFETTGTDPLAARAVSVSLHVLDPHGLPAADPFDRIINPGVPIPPEASAVHGIDQEMVLLKGDDPEAVFNALQIEIGHANTWERPLAIFNVRYDWTLLHAENRRHGLKAPPAVALLDPTIIDRTLDKYRRGSRKLADVAGHYGVTLEDAHSADADAIATAGIMRALVERFPKELQITLADLQVLQARWFVEWRDGINAYWSRTGKDQRVEGTWPLFDPQPDLFAP